MNRTLRMALAVLLALSLLAGCTQTPTQAPAEGIKDGSYVGTAKGIADGLEVEVTFTGGKITAVTVLKHNETAGVSDPAIERIPKAIVDNNSVAVDTVSGVTMTSNGIIEAVKAAITAAGGDVADFSTEVGKAEQSTQTREVDYAVAGGGLAGLTSAITAAEKGAKVVLVEKTAEVGGSLKLASGNFISVNSAIAKEYGVDDNKEAAMALWRKTADAGPVAPDKYPDYDRVSFYLDHVDGILTWMKDHGVPYNRASEANPDTMVKIYTDGKGPAVVAALEKAARDAGVEIITDAAVTKLITENGKVVGFEASGPAISLTVKAKAVMLATGGFGMNPEMLASKVPAYATAKAQGGAGNTGDGFKMAESVNAAFYENPWTIPSSLGLNPAFGAAAGDVSAVNFRQGILVDTSGKRFVKEDHGIGSVVTNAVAVKGTDCFAILGSSNADAVKALEAGLTSGVVFKGDTLEALAAAAGISSDLVKTANLYDADAAKGTDSAFGKAAANLIALGEGPYYAVKVIPVHLGTFAGVVTDYDGHVIDKDGKIIEGLYAAGEMSNRAFYNQAYVGAASLSLYSIAAKLAAEAAIG